MRQRRPKKTNYWKTETLDPQALILFVRRPEPGRVKTRLARDIGVVPAARVYERLLRHSLGILTDFNRKNPRTTLVVCFTPKEDGREIEEAFQGPWTFLPQEGAHLGERMARAFDWAFAMGCRRVVLAGSDIFDLEAGDLEAAFHALRSHGSVLGPATDGGFYLVGLQRPSSKAFSPKTWGTEDVFSRTEACLTRDGLAPAILRPRSDIDRPDDLQRLEHHPAFRTRLTVIVPTLTGPDVLEPWLAGIRKILWPGDRILVVQGSDGPPSRAPSLRPDDPVRWIVSEKGRGIQLNRGAREAEGNVLWFLHDDCRPPTHAAFHVRKIAADESAALGCFRLRFEPSDHALDGVARWANLRTRLFRLPYGDQGLFCRSDTFRAAGGFQRPYLMEDVDFVRACRSLGRLLILDETLATSPTRYRRRGVLRASLQNHLTLLLHLCGTSNERLYRWYYRKASPGGALEAGRDPRRSLFDPEVGRGDGTL